MINKEAAIAWQIQNGYTSMEAINGGGCENFAMYFKRTIPNAELHSTEDHIDWDHGQWPGGHIWLFDGKKHYDSEALDGVEDWQQLPFFQRAFKETKTVTFLSKLWMGTIEKPTAVISIGEKGEDLPFFAVDPIDLLRLEFDDVDQDLGPEYTMFDWTHARKILQFEHRYKDHDIIVHCAAGVSRSAAVAMFLSNHTKRALLTEKPCSGDYSRYNKWVYQQLKVTRVDLLASGGQITK
jgi:hypothetical protein